MAGISRFKQGEFAGRQVLPFSCIDAAVAQVVVLSGARPEVFSDTGTA